MANIDEDMGKLFAEWCRETGSKAIDWPAFAAGWRAALLYAAQARETERLDSDR